MARYIDADNAVNVAKRVSKLAVVEFEKILDCVPTADVVEVKHGYWFDTYKGGSKKGCFVCRCQADLSKQGKEYCSRCGAKMDGKPKKEGTKIEHKNS